MIDWLTFGRQRKRLTNDRNVRKMNAHVCMTSKKNNSQFIETLRKFCLPQQSYLTFTLSGLWLGILSISSTSYTLISTPSSCLLGLGGRSFHRLADLWGDEDGSEFPRDGGALRLRLDPRPQKENIFESLNCCTCDIKGVTI